jgi:SAM-dependent methyltransferase
LHVTGVDFATVPASGDPRIDILANMRIESLPFTDGSFAAAVSQFGFEYGSLMEASCELARVLQPGAPISFLVHHAGARIATDSIAHRGTLEAICGVELEAAFQSGSSTALDRQLGLIRRRYPRERIIDEAAEGLRRHIGLPPAHRAEIWQAVKAALAPELVMLADLDAASVSPEQMPRWLQSLARGFNLQPPSVLMMTSGQPLCWQVNGTRRAIMH